MIKSFKNSWVIVLFVLILFFNNAMLKEKDREKVITLQSTTSTENSGFYDYILPIFFEKTGIKVRVVSAGTGQALKNAANGDGDILITHSKSDEESFVEEGLGVYRHDLMYNDFVFVGPSKHINSKVRPDSLSLFLKKISDGQLTFLSRGDDSGTHKKELKLWETVSFKPYQMKNGWYKETGSGMGDTLNIAAAMDAITLTDRATWISFRNKSDLAIIFENHPALFNQYGLVLVKPRNSDRTAFENAKIFCNWLLGNEGQHIINAFRKDGEQLFFADQKGRHCD